MDAIKNIINPNKPLKNSIPEDMGTSEIPVSAENTGFQPQLNNTATTATTAPPSTTATAEPLIKRKPVPGQQQPALSGAHLGHRYIGSHNQEQQPWRHRGRDEVAAGVGPEAAKYQQHSRGGSYATSDGMGSNRSSAELSTAPEMTAPSTFPIVNPYPGQAALGPMSGHMSGRGLAFSGLE